MSLPLESIYVTGDLYDIFGYIKVKATYVNTHDTTFETAYNFCLDKNATVDSLSVSINDKTFVGNVQEKSNAAHAYDNAKQENKRAVLLSKNDDVYTLDIGSILPKDRIIITYTYVTRLTICDNNYKFVYPTNIGSRYGCMPINNLSNMKNISNYATSHLNSHICYMKFNCITYGEKITELYSYTKDSAIERTTERISDNNVICTITTAPMEGDFNLFIKSSTESCVYSGTIDNDSYCLVSHRIPYEEITIVPKKYVFVLDRSGSMSGERINSAVDALCECLKQINPGSYFNIVSFGSNYSAMMDKFMEVTDDNVNWVIDTLRSYTANMGGTELSKCLYACLTDDIGTFDNYSYLENTADTSNVNNMERIMIFITDGQVHNQQEIYGIIKAHSNNTRIFTVGIGKDASRQLLEQMATISSGTYEMIVDNKNVSSAINKI